MFYKARINMKTKKWWDYLFEFRKTDWNGWIERKKERKKERIRKRVKHWKKETYIESNLEKRT